MDTRHNFSGTIPINYLLSNIYNTAHMLPVEVMQYWLEAADIHLIGLRHKLCLT